MTPDPTTFIKEVCKKKWTGHSNTKFSVNIGPTETYYIANQWKLNENFAELCRFEIAALIGQDNLVKMSPLFCYSPWCNGSCIKVVLVKLDFPPLTKVKSQI